MYPENELLIYDRYGKEIYKKNGYNNEWKAENVPSGVYYYRLFIESTNQVYKGWVHVMK